MWRVKKSRGRRMSKWHLLNLRTIDFFLLALTKQRREKWNKNKYVTFRDMKNKKWAAAANRRNKKGQSKTTSTLNPIQGAPDSIYFFY